MNSKQIQSALFQHYLRSDIVICPNTEALYHEADLVLLMPSGMVTEIEVKISRADFKADFKKEAKHRLLQSSGRIWGQCYCANSFYYAVPAGLIAKSEVPAYAGLIYIHPTALGFADRVEVIRTAPRLHGQKWPAEKLLRRLARSLMYKVFNADCQDLPEHVHLTSADEKEASV